MWAKESIMYQIYPLGFCGAPKKNDGIATNRLDKLFPWCDYIKELGATCVLFNPLFESDCHGYDTRDFTKVDVRLGDNETFRKLCKKLHQDNIKVLLDGVFNHVGRGFFGFQDVLLNKENSIYKDWFYIDFSNDNHYQDGFWYEGWEGHFELVKLNLKNQEVVNYLFSAIKGWVEEFDIDGLRLDVAYCLDREFLKKLRIFCDALKDNFFLIGEMLFGDYKQIVNESMVDSATNYECYKGLYSSFNDRNLFEIAHSLNRQFGPEQWTLYRDLHLLNFVDNHDVSRIASIIKEKENIPLVYALLFAMKGIPCIYYGSEWGIEGKKEDGDDTLRPQLDTFVTNELSNIIKKLIEIHKQEEALMYGSHNCLVIRNEQLVLEREFKGKKVIIAINLSENKVELGVESLGEHMRNLMTDEMVQCNGSISLEGHSFLYLSNE